MSKWEYRIDIDVLDNRHEFLANGAIWFYAISCNQVLATLKATDSGGGCWFFNDLFVSECCRREGIAKRLIGFAIDHLSKVAEPIAFTASIVAKNEPSLALFARCGFLIAHAYDGELGPAYMVTRPHNNRARTQGGESHA